MLAILGYVVFYNVSNHQVREVFASTKTTKVEHSVTLIVSPLVRIRTFRVVIGSTCLLLDIDVVRKSTCFEADFVCNLWLLQLIGERAVDVLEGYFLDGLLLFFRVTGLLDVSSQGLLWRAEV